METQKAQGPVVGDNKPNEGHGKKVGLVNAPVQSMAPTSNDKDNSFKQEFKIIDEANQDYPDEDKKEKFNSVYPIGDLKLGQGFFVPNKQDQSTDKHVEDMWRHLALARNYYSEVEHDEHGDEIWETLIAKERKKNEDGTLQLDGEGKVITGANQLIRPKLVGNRNFVVRGVAKGFDLGNGKAPSDGVLVIRV